MDTNPIKNGLLFGLLLASHTVSAVGYTFAGGFPEDPKGFPAGPSYQSPISEKKSDEILEKDGPGSKPLVQIKRGDLEFTVGGDSKFESFFARNVVLLNKNIPDELGYFKQTMNITADLAYGERKYGHDAIKIFADLRQKNMWGNTGKFLSSSSDTVKLNGTDISVGSHSHNLTKPYVWIKDAWIQLSMNAIFNAKTESKYLVKIGLFPFYVGRGIALGPVYGLGKDFLGIYTGYQNDQSAPGILLHGEVVKDRLSYDLYYAKLEEKSSGLSETFNHVKYNHVGRSQAPWRGVSKDNDLFALRFKWKALKNKAYADHLTLEPYFMFNDASDRTIEFEADAKSELGALGMGVEYKCKGFEWGAEAATNMGQEHVKNIDRNIIELSVNKTDGSGGGQLFERYTHVFTQNPNTVTSPTKAAVESATVTLVQAEKDKQLKNGGFIGTTTAGTDLYNALNRYRPSYTNRYRGWMFVTDASYKVNSFKVAASYGYTSGDQNPHGSGREFDKNYNGFIGLQEYYAGKRVPSVLVLDARKIKRPLTITENTNFSLDDPSFTDMQYGGFGAKWFPIPENENKLYVHANALGFWKVQASNKYDLENEAVSPTLRAGNFLGIELNLRVKHEVLKDLYVFGDAAVFFPGTHYDDVSGTPLSSDVFSKLDEVDQTAVDSAQFRLGKDTAYYMNFGVTYKF